MHAIMANTNSPQKTAERHTKLATFNVQGINEASKRLEHISDMTSYKIDICCLQEIKVSEIRDEQIKNFE